MNNNKFWTVSHHTNSKFAVLGIKLVHIVQTWCTV